MIDNQKNIEEITLNTIKNTKPIIFKKQKSVFEVLRIRQIWDV